MMRQANFPDQKALTARDETNSKPSQQSSAGSLRTVVTCLSSLSLKETQSRKRSLSTTTTYWPHTGHSYHCFGQRVEGSSVLIQSITSLCKAPPHVDNPQWLFPESFLPHVPMRWPRLCTSDLLITMLWLGPTPTEPISFGPNSFLCLISKSPWQDRRNLSICTAMGTWGNVQGVRLHSKTTEPTSVCQALPAGLLFTNPPHLFGSFCSFFLNGRYSTLPLIK